MSRNHRSARYATLFRRHRSNSDKLAASITRPHHPDNRKSFPPSDKSTSRQKQRTSKPGLVFHPVGACLRHTSAVFAPSSCSFKISITCSSVNRLRYKAFRRKWRLHFSDAIKELRDPLHCENIREPDLKSAARAVRGRGDRTNGRGDRK